MNVDWSIYDRRQRTGFLYTLERGPDCPGLPQLLILGIVTIQFGETKITRAAVFSMLAVLDFTPIQGG
ncbi:hypothetical protein EFT87_08060 [Schleiferilactobacillus harbinensis]|nr:hypothetical protein [Schleiferilactobacillus harbinensis]